MKLIFYSFVYIIFFGLSNSAYSEEKCPQINIRTWTIHSLWPYKGEKYLSSLEKCLEGNKEKQIEVDNLAISIILNIEVLKESLRQPVIDFVDKILLKNAVAGHPSSQHNYAALRNARAGSVISKLIRQDYPLFVFWTRKAAAQKDPRAVFNIAVRMTREKPDEYIDQDFINGFILLSFLKDQIKFYPTELKSVEGIIQKKLDKITKVLGTKKIEEISKYRASFDFNSLEPVESVPKY